MQTNLLRIFFVLVLIGSLGQIGRAAPNQIGKFVADPPVDYDSFGSGLALSGNTALVGAGGEYFPWNQGSKPGSVYVLQKTGFNQWTQATRLMSSNSSPGDQFGRSIDVFGDTAIVGARFDNTVAQYAGSAYLFQKDGAGSWHQVQQLTAPDGAAQDFFGTSVSIYGDMALIGAPNAGVRGKAYLFRDTGGGHWTHTATLQGSDTDGNDLFGESVSLSDKTAVVGAPQWDDGNVINVGRAYVYQEVTGGSWPQVATLASFGGYNSAFGKSVALGNGLALVGAPGGSTSLGPGAVQTYSEIGPGDWRGSGTLVPEELKFYDQIGFGSSIAFDGETAIMGAPGIFGGQAYVYERGNHNQLLQVAKLVASDQLQFERFGEAVALGNGMAIVGKTIDIEDSARAGSAYLYQLKVVPEPTSARLVICAAIVAACWARKGVRNEWHSVKRNA